MPLNLDDFENVRAKAEIFYKSIGNVHCPYFKDKVYFNMSGLEHLKFKKERKARSRQDQYMRLKLINLAPEILKASGTLQGISEIRSFEKIRTHNRSDLLMKHVEYYEFIAVIRSIRLKIIVKRIETGQRFFWSIIPYWEIDKYSKRRKLYNGDPVQD